MTHYAAIWIFGQYYTITKPGPGPLAFIVVLGVLFLILVAWLAMVFYDIPVRKYFNKKRQKKNIA
jgi:peptidoglycan/LPS O-acetylase OafA/YrhL